VGDPNIEVLIGHYAEGRFHTLPTDFVVSELARAINSNIQDQLVHITHNLNLP
jgi:RecJ-like exonuclease